jgi:O-succinylbenzoic acid--CoA ligase
MAAPSATSVSVPDRSLRAVPALAALDLPGGPAFVDALRRVWDRGDAAFPLDQRLPAPARAQVLAAMRPATVVAPDGEVRWTGGDPEPVAQGDALVIATSGSSGGPKGVVLTHDALAAHARAVHERLAVSPATDRWFACLPLVHMGGLGVVVRALLGGVGLDVVASLDATAFAAAPAELGVTLTSLVPTALDRLDGSGFRWIVLGGAADRGVRPPNVVRTYGLTESGGGVVYDGRPLPGVEVRVADGEVQLRGPTLLRCYRDGRDPRTADGWFPTGDLGALHEGELVVHGRNDDMIVTGGENVWPAAVEAVLDRLPSVREAAVVGRADDEWGQKVVALVVPADPSSPPTLDAVRAAVRAELGAAAAPKELALVDRLPRTALGKLRRDDLR